MKKFLIILGFIVMSCNMAFAGPNKEVYEVENNKEVSFKVLEKLFENADYKIYLNGSRLSKDKLNKEDKNSIYHYIGYTEDNEHFFETIKQEKETIKERVKETVKEKETPAKQEIKSGNTSNTGTTTITMEQISQADVKDKPVYFNRSQWVEIYKDKILSPKELVNALKNLGEASIISISCIVQRQTIEYDKSQITEDILIDIGRKEGKGNFKVMPNSDNEYIYLTPTQYSQP
ncbi:MAG: hypothetical protein Q4E99_02865 [Bacillota bacterium]|nr:hypothetical protein [Bacillota bacterium]